MTSHELTQDEYRRLCLRAFENLPTDSTVTMEDVDAILTWCLPEYDRLKGIAKIAPGEAEVHGVRYPRDGRP